MPNLELQRALTRLAETALAEIRPAAGAAGEAIGRVIALDGDAYAVRVDGARVALDIGTEIFQGDALETGSGAGLGIAFVDGTSFTLGAEASMVVDEFVYDPAGGDGAMAVSLVQGLFIYVSGEVAHQNPDAVALTTPVATIGIRGTAIAIQAGPPGTANLVSLLVAPDDTLGQVVVTNAAGTALLDEVNETTTIAGADAAPSDGYFLSEQQIVQLYGLPLLLSPYDGDPRDLDAGQDGDEAGEADPAAEEAAPAGEAAPAEGEPEAPPPDQALAPPPDQTFVTLGEPGAGPPLGGLETTIVTALGLPGPGFNSPFDTTLTVPPPPDSEPPPPPPDTAGGDRNVFVPIDSGTVADTVSTAGTTGNDVLIGGPGSDSLAGLAGDDLLDGGAGNDVLLGGAGRDVLAGGADDDVLDGGDGGDILAPGTGRDTILGGADIDIVLYSDVPAALLSSFIADVGGATGGGTTPAGPIFPAGAALAPITVDFLAGTVTQGGAVSTISGIEGVLGTPLADLFRDGGPGHEFDGGAGDDTFLGVAGSVVHYTTAQSGVFVDLIGGFAQGDASVGRDTLVGIRSVEGSRFDDQINGSAAPEALFGGAGRDTLNGASGDDTLDGEDGDDVLSSGNGADLVFGGFGNDTLVALDDLFGDVYIGGPGVDALSFTATTTSLIVDLRVNQALGRNVDVVNEIENVTGESANDVLIGDINANSLAGDAGDDQIEGGQGDDVIDGGAGFDVAVFADAAATGGLYVDLAFTGPQAVGGGLGSDRLVSIEGVVGGSGGDTMFGSAVANVLFGGDGNDALFAGAGDDDLVGGQGDDNLQGDAGSDILDGDLGSDILTGGTGGDLMSGGAGLDVFFVQPDAFEPGYLTLAAAGLLAGLDFDAVTDFNATFGEKLHIPSSAIGGFATGALAFGANYSVITGSFDSTIGGTNAAFAAGQPSFVFSQSDGVLFFDSNGGAPGYSVVAEVTGPTLAAGDIIVV